MLQAPTLCHSGDACWLSLHFNHYHHCFCCYFYYCYCHCHWCFFCLCIITLLFRGGPHSSLMFCTNGVLLRMLTSGDGLEGVTHIVVDEIHERDKFADFLLIMLRDLLPSKPHLHLVLMSATLNVALFTDYFHGCPLIQVPGYTYPVQVYLARAFCNSARAAGYNVVLMCFCCIVIALVCLAWVYCSNKLLPWLSLGICA
jgi:hypothetical protein